MLFTSASFHPPHWKLPSLSYLTRYMCNDPPPGTTPELPSADENTVLPWLIPVRYAAPLPASMATPCPRLIETKPASPVCTHSSTPAPLYFARKIVALLPATDFAVPSIEWKVALSVNHPVA